MMTHMVMNGRIQQRFGDDDGDNNNSEMVVGETSNSDMIDETSVSSSLVAKTTAIHDEEEARKESFPPTEVQQDVSTDNQHQHHPEEDPNPTSRRSPTRGVKKVPSLRRGAAAYAQLLQSAVKASIETSRKDILTDDHSNEYDQTHHGIDQPPTIPPPPSPYYYYGGGGGDTTMDVDFEGGRHGGSSSVYHDSPTTRGRNKRRAYEQEQGFDGSYRQFTSNIPNQRRRPSSEMMEVEEN